MISNGPARTFTREAVEAWLFRLSGNDWEQFIDKNNLKQGRIFYKEGALSSLDIEANQIIVTQKVNREETYSVVEWKEHKPEIRTSCLDDNVGTALATAGLYEIEELVAEIHEEDPLLDKLSQEIDEEAEKQINVEQKQSQKVPDSNEESTDEESLIPLSISLDVSLNKGLTATPIGMYQKIKKTVHMVQIR